MIRIGKKIETIDFDILGVELSLTKSDETLAKMSEISEMLITEAEKHKENQSVEVLKDYREKAIKGYDTLFGEGTFAKVEEALSEEKGKYTIQMVAIFFEIAKNVNSGFGEEIPEEYLDGKA